MTTPATEPTAPQLSDEQRRIIAHRGGHLQVVACAGSGKTETVAQRVAALLAEGVAPSAVVAFTFTRAAADELRSRIHRRVAERLPDLALERLAPMFVGTIHAYCLRLLQERAPRFATFDLYDAHRVIGLLLREYDDLGMAALETRGRVQTVRAFLRSVDVVENEDLDVTAALPDGPFRDVHRARLGREVSIALDELLDRLGVTFARSPEALAALRAQLLALRTALPQEPAADLVAHLYDVLASLGVRAWEGAVERLGVLARVSQILADFEAVTRRAWTTVTDGVMHVGAGHAGGPVFLRALADYLSFYAQSAYEDFAGDLDATTPAVRDVFPSRMTGRKGSWMLPRGSFPAARYEGSDDDERRLFYVAMTRARDHLHLSLHQRDHDGNAARASPLLHGLLPGGISVSDAALPLPEVSPPATSASDERLRVSYSALASYLRCPYQHWLSSRIGFASPTVRQSGYGRAVHHLLRRLAEHLRATGRDPTGDEVDALFAHEFYLPNGDQDAYDALERRARAIVKTSLTQWRDDLARVWAVERPLELHLDVADLEGRADVILDREDGVEGQLALVDYKTRPVQQDDGAAQQLRVYAAAARGEGFTVRAAYLHDLTASKASARHPVDVSAEAVTASLASLSGSLIELRARRFEGRPGVQCGRCELRAICRCAPKSVSA